MLMENLLLIIAIVILIMAVVLFAIFIAVPVSAELNYRKMKRKHDEHVKRVEDEIHGKVRRYRN
jgi:hypothetical protein